MANPPKEVTTIPCKKETSSRDVETIQFSYIWTINNFTASHIEKDEKITSPLFLTSDFGIKQEWCLETCPFIQSPGGKDSLSIYLRLVSSDVPELMASVVCHIVNVNGEKALSSHTLLNTMCNFTCGDSYAFKINIGADSFAKKNTDLLPNDSLTILCEIDMMYNVIFSKTKVSKCQLVYDVGRLFGSERSSDVTITISDREIPAHRVILAARSPVFSAMFEHNMAEDKHSHVDIKDIDYEIVNEMLRFIYTGEVTNVKKFPDRLLVAADKYNLPILKSICEKTLRSNIAVINAADILILADLHSCEQLKAAAIEFIGKHTTKVMETESFQIIVNSYPHLTTAILHLSAMKNLSLQKRLSEMETKN